ncbi:prepilin peptidase [Thalassovita mediterranea]|jgi:prepilin peptidase CpaA|uniref:Flp pilus assembly protein, protease CpaA n=1 Tax=Thalassovita mediterranea TaxID=340021 RepID=A0A0P1GNY6_9RHOB|nr:prepilin peptidase [Thalassovita mediterranea]MCG7575193.1 prepilin peptidase [Phaeobacter sp. CNT1-3]CUH84001.1 Flp pilus assembly protein, protease CpaA [Thalassovita mediterranea]SIS27924.1 prepilin peptidase CpaA [Thalassovita mediterranea]
MPDLMYFLWGSASGLAQDAFTGLVFFVLTLPLCIWVAMSDLRHMLIRNNAVLALAGVFVVAGLFLMPLPQYGWQLAQLGIVLCVGILMNALGLLGAGDAKFAAAAAPYVMLGDLRFIILLFALILLGSVATHRLVRMTPLRNLAPDWASWERKKDFPMGLALGPTLSAYLALAALYGG